MSVSSVRLSWILLLVSFATVVSSATTEAQILRRNRRSYNNQNCANCNQSTGSQAAGFLAPGETLIKEWVANPASSAASTTAYASETPAANPAPVVNSTPVVYSQPAAIQPVSYQQPASYQQPVVSSNTSSAGGYRPMPAFTHSFGTQPHDIGYIGPGDMRTHLWREHGSDLSAAGMDYHRVMSLSAAAAQSWHNYFHGAETSPPM